MKGDTELIEKLLVVVRWHCGRNVCRRLQIEDRIMAMMAELNHFERREEVRR